MITENRRAAKGFKQVVVALLLGFFTASAVQAQNLTINDVRVVEGNVNLSFTISLSSPAVAPVTFDFVTDETLTINHATEGVDYTATAGSAVILIGESSYTVDVPLLQDALVEGSERFQLKLTNVVGATAINTVGNGFITDDDYIPVVSIADSPGNQEVDARVHFLVSLDDFAAHDVTVDFVSSPGTLTPGLEYDPLSGTLTIPAGFPNKTISIIEKDDDWDEDDETVFMTISNPGGATLLGGAASLTATGTVLDDDPAPTVTIVDLAANEGTSESGVTTFNVAITLSAPSGRTLTMKADTSGGTATPGSDYTSLVSVDVVIPPGNGSWTVPVAVNPDFNDEFDQTFNVVLSALTNATFADDTAVVTILDDDAPPVLTVSSTPKTEGDAGTSAHTITFSLNFSSEKAVSVDWATSDDTAVAGSDYVATGGTVNFPVNDASETVTVNVNGDTTDEYDETYNIDLSGEVNCTPSAASSSHTIADDDAPPTLTISNHVIVELTDVVVTPVDVSLTLSGNASAKTIVFNYDTVDGTAKLIGLTGRDYIDKSGTLTYLPGETSKTVRAEVVADSYDEYDEEFYLEVSNWVADDVNVPDATGTIAVTDDDDPPTINAFDHTADEGTTTFRPHVTLTEPSGKPITFTWTYVPGGTATEAAVYVDGVDFAAASGTYTFEPNAYITSLGFPVYEDNVDEFDETFFYTITPDATHVAENRVVLGDLAGVVTILDDDEPPVISIGDTSVVEGDVGTQIAAFPVSLSRRSEKTITVNYTTADVTALAGLDYVAASTALVINAGTTSTTIDITVNNENLDEIDETFVVNIDSVVNATGAPAFVTGTIVNDDIPPLVSIDDVTVTEDAVATAIATFTISLSEPSGKTVSIDFGTANGSAIEPDDYTANSGTLTWGPHDGSVRTVDIAVNPDDLRELTETAWVNLSNPVDLTIVDGSGLLTIIDDDQSTTAIYLITVRGQLLTDIGPRSVANVGPGVLIVDTKRELATALYKLRVQGEGDFDIREDWHAGDILFAEVDNGSQFGAQAITSLETDLVTDEVDSYSARSVAGAFGGVVGIGGGQSIDLPRALAGHGFFGDNGSESLLQVLYNARVSGAETLRTNNANEPWETTVEYYEDFLDVEDNDDLHSLFNLADTTAAPAVGGYVLVYNTTSRAVLHGEGIAFRRTVLGHLIVDPVSLDATLILRWREIINGVDRLVYRRLNLADDADVIANPVDISTAQYVVLGATDIDGIPGGRQIDIRHLGGKLVSGVDVGGGITVDIPLALSGRTLLTKDVADDTFDLFESAPTTGAIDANLTRTANNDGDSADETADKIEELLQDSGFLNYEDLVD